MCGGSQQGTFIHKMAKCKQCNVYEMHQGTTQLASVGAPSDNSMPMAGNEDPGSF